MIIQQTTLVCSEHFSFIYNKLSWFLQNIISVTYTTNCCDFLKTLFQLHVPVVVSSKHYFSCMYPLWFPQNIISVACTSCGFLKTLFQLHIQQPLVVSLKHFSYLYNLFFLQTQTVVSKKSSA